MKKQIFHPQISHTKKLMLILIVIFMVVSLMTIFPLSTKAMSLEKSCELDCKMSNNILTVYRIEATSKSSPWTIFLVIALISIFTLYKFATYISKKFTENKTKIIPRAFSAIICLSMCGIAVFTLYQSIAQTTISFWGQATTIKATGIDILSFAFDRQPELISILEEILGQYISTIDDLPEGLKATFYLTIFNVFALIFSAIICFIKSIKDMICEKRGIFTPFFTSLVLLCYSILSLIICNQIKTLLEEYFYSFITIPEIKSHVILPFIVQLILCAIYLALPQIVKLSENSNSTTANTLYDSDNVKSIELLKKYKELFDNNIISEEEFNTKKSELLYNRETSTPNTLENSNQQQNTDTNEYEQPYQ